MSDPSLATSAAQIVRLLPKLSAGGQMRLLQFAEAMLAQKQWTRRQRAARLERFQ
jgi:hypothetical protein